jgi:hypothetical protein
MRVGNFGQNGNVYAGRRIMSQLRHWLIGASCSLFIWGTTGGGTNAQYAETAGVKGMATQFDWPLRGRIVADFGPQLGGQQNDGINIAAAEGTPVMAASDGVVAYAGNELKGYGNLVLIRHSNGFVTAYAHTSEILVKRFQSVKRGEMIAKVGKTGYVSEPQLHFEIRNGSTPVDPRRFLSRDVGEPRIPDLSLADGTSTVGERQRPPAEASVDVVQTSPKSIPSLVEIRRRRVHSIQLALTEIGYGPIELTGVHDQPTRRAIEQFERARGMPITGMISDYMIKELAEMVGRPIPVTSAPDRR